MISRDDESTWAARARAWRMFARLADAGPVDPALAAAGLGGFDPEPDEAAAAHHRWLSWEVLPWESVFLTADRLLGGDRSAEVAAETGAGDDLAGELAHLARLCEDVAGAGGEPTAPRIARVERFASHHLAAWLPIVAEALRPAPGYGPALALAAELLATHAPPAVLPPSPDVDPLTGGLRDLAEWLSTPLATGMWWTHAEITALGDALALPIGFGSRGDRLEALLRNAGDHRRAREAILALSAIAARWEAHWRATGSPWAERTARAVTVLSEMAARSS